MSEIKKLILEKISQEELNKEIEKKRKKYGKLLAEEDIFVLIAKELNIKIKNGVKTKINEIVPGQSVDIEAEIKQIYPVKQFRKGKGFGKMQSVILTDETGEARLTFWQKDIDNIKKLQKGGHYFFYSLEPREYNGKIYLNFGADSSIEENLDKPKREIKYLKIEDLKENMYDVNVKAKILAVYPAKEFIRDNVKRKVVNFVIGDETGKIKATAWTENADSVLSLPEKAVVAIEDGYTKINQEQLELHLGYKSRIYEIDEKLGAESFDVWAAGLSNKKINQISLDLKGDIIVEGEILEKEIKEYFVCNKCGGKIEKDSSICPKCGETEPMEKKFCILKIKDETGGINAIVFDNCTKLKEKSQIKIVGYVKKNPFSEELEIIAKAVKTE